MEDLTKIRAHLIALYGEAAGQTAFTQVCGLIDHYRGRIPAPRLTGLSQRDAILITYGDQVREVGEAPLRTLANFCAAHLTGAVSGIHILPFYPYTSDDGFSVVDYRAVDPALGSWDEVWGLRERFGLMFDAVINHISAHSAWFKAFCQGDPRYADYFITVPDGTDLTQVVRPRTLPLLTTFQVKGEPKNIWTTFSADQVDLNYANPAVLLDILETLLFYVERGAELIRLDAIAFLWKIPGTSCLHLPQTHRVIQLIRAMLDTVAPHVGLITETNVPHADNLSYFGDGSNEAQMVYNFALPPLILHTLHTANADRLSQWAADLKLPSKKTTFFNFLASHDGVGLNPVRGILSQAEIDALVARTLANGGLVSNKTNPDGSISPYELNINYFDALNGPPGSEPQSTQVARFMASQAIMLAVIGVPGIYFHSLFGSRGWRAGVEQSGHNRTINRQKFLRSDLEAELEDKQSVRHDVFSRYTHLLRVRSNQGAFDPYGEMQVLEGSAQVFAVLRASQAGSPVLCLQNVSQTAQSINTDLISSLGQGSALVIDLVTGQPVSDVGLVLNPYQTMWLTRVE